MIDTQTGLEPCIETSHTFDTGLALDLHKIPTFRHESSLLELAGAESDFGRQASPGSRREKLQTDVADWLPFASEKYRISDRLSDYVVVPVSVVASDIPNRNLVSFSFSKLTEFNTDLGMMHYRSWKAKPTHIEHQNQDVTAAKGVIFDVSLHKMSRAADDVWKVVALCGFDRTKDPLLANAILTGERTEYSMGAYVFGYCCSVCGSMSERPDRPKCDHVDRRRSKFNMFEVGGVNRLAYWNVGDFRGFEISSVADAAFKGAATPRDLIINVGGT